MNNTYEEIIKSLSSNIRPKVEQALINNSKIEEIRLRCEKPLIINAEGKDYFYNTKLN